MREGICNKGILLSRAIDDLNLGNTVATEIMLPCKVCTSQTSHEVGSKFVQSWAEVCTKLARSLFEVGPKLHEVRSKLARTLYEVDSHVPTHSNEVVPNFERSSPELCTKFSSEVRFEMETYFPRLPYHFHTLHSTTMHTYLQG